MPPRIVVVGSINMDLVVRAARFPAPGETLLGGALATHPGGKGANQAVAAARLGAEVAMVGCVGRDAYGAELRAVLQREGVDVAHVLSRGGEATGVGVITVCTATGENAIVVASGTNRAMTARDVEAARETIEESDALILQLETTDEAVRRAAEIARGASVPVFLNAAPAGPLPAGLPRLIDILIVNEAEARVLAGLGEPRRDGETGSPSDEQIASHLHAFIGGHVLVTLGARGALYHDGRDVRHQPAFEVRPVDTTAAGDAFVGAFAVVWCEGLDGPEALRFANAAAACAVTRAGAMPSLPTRSEVERMLATTPTPA